MGPVIEITGDTRVTRLQKFAQSRDCVSAIGRALTMTSSLMTPTSIRTTASCWCLLLGVGLIKIWVPKTATSWANKALPTRWCNPLMY